MHITEGIITGGSVVAYTGAGLFFVGWGAARMKKFLNDFPGKKPLLGMGGALIFFMSLIPIPAFTGTCSHPTGTPLTAILLGPLIGCALAGVSLLLQAAFFAHGGFSTWGANVIALGVFGCFFGWGVFKIFMKIGFPLWAAGFAGGLIGNVMVYASSGAILATTLVNAPSPQYSLSGYLAAIYAAYLPTQLPIAVGEMIVTGMALQYAYRQRPEVLEEFGVVHKPAKIIQPGKITHVIFVPAVFLLVSAAPCQSAGIENGSKNVPVSANPSETRPEDTARFSGMDEAVNEKLAQDAGLVVREPFIDAEKMGDLWNLLLLSAGGACGFIVGKYGHLLWGRRKIQ
ncbi:MAG: energy-coupling factor ABC transporter permease [Desulfobacterales bacterium]|jgi:cobalt/nickel transport system permease protein